MVSVFCVAMYNMFVIINAGDNSGSVCHIDTTQSQWSSSFCRYTGEPSLSSTTRSTALLAPSTSLQQSVNVIYQPLESSTTPMELSELPATPVRSTESPSTVPHQYTVLLTYPDKFPFATFL